MVNVLGYVLELWSGLILGLWSAPWLRRMVSCLGLGLG